MSNAARHWCFTGFVPEGKDGYDRPDWDEKKMGYLVYQGEWSPKCGRFHWQGYVQFKAPESMNSVKKALGVFDGWHLEVSKGDPMANFHYVTKNASRCIEPAEFGKIKLTQGQRGDLIDAKECIEKGNFKDIAAGTYIKFHKGLQAWAQLMGYRQRDEIHRKWKSHVTVLWGPAGVGKSKKAYDMFGGDNADTYRFNRGVTGSWWTGYNAHPNVIVDEFRPEDWSINDFLLAMDRYPYKVSVHGGLVNFLAEKIIITTTLEPRLWCAEGKWKGRDAEVLRRIDAIEYVAEYLDEDGLGDLYQDEKPAVTQPVLVQPPVQPVKTNPLKGLYIE